MRRPSTGTLTISWPRSVECTPMIWTLHFDRSMTMRSTWLMQLASPVCLSIGCATRLLRAKSLTLGGKGNLPFGAVISRAKANPLEASTQ
jgi:hypothetical protein